MSAPSYEVLPMTMEEVLHLLHGLERAINDNPALLLTDANLGTLRLALTAARGIEQTQADAHEVDHQVELVGTLKEQREQAVALLADANRQVFALTQERSAFRNQVKDLEAKVEALQADTRSQTLVTELEKARQRLSFVQRVLHAGEIASPEAREDPLVKDILKNLQSLTAAQEQLAQEKGKVSSLMTDLSGRKQATLEAKEQLALLERKVKDAVLGQITLKEYSALHPDLRFNNRAKVPCCPFCQGLDPSRTQHKESGHKKGCFFRDLRSKVEVLFPG